jgi:hypothetical protein
MSPARRRPHQPTTETRLPRTLSGLKGNREEPRRPLPSRPLKSAAPKRWPGAWPFSGRRRRNGKIARLPWAIREELNESLRLGEPGKELVEWLNDKPEVRVILEGEHGFQPITEQNVSESKEIDEKIHGGKRRLMKVLEDLCFKPEGKGEDQKPSSKSGQSE